MLEALFAYDQCNVLYCWEALPAKTIYSGQWQLNYSFDWMSWYVIFDKLVGKGYNVWKEGQVYAFIIVVNYLYIRIFKLKCAIMSVFYVRSISIQIGLGRMEMLSM